MLSLIFIGGGLLVLSVSTGRLVAVQSNSMRPTFQAGDMLFIRRSKSSQISVGDIISYKNPQDMHSTISHRVTAIRGGGYITQGDAQQTPGKLVAKATVAGKAVGYVPKLGFVVNWLHSLWGRVLTCYIPALCIVGSEIWRLSRRLYFPVYRLHTHR